MSFGERMETETGCKFEHPSGGGGKDTPVD